MISRDRIPDHWGDTPAKGERDAFRIPRECCRKDPPTSGPMRRHEPDLGGSTSRNGRHGRKGLLGGSKPLAIVAAVAWKRFRRIRRPGCDRGVVLRRSGRPAPRSEFPEPETAVIFGLDRRKENVRTRRCEVRIGLCLTPVGCGSNFAFRPSDFELASCSQCRKAPEPKTPILRAFCFQ